MKVDVVLEFYIIQWDLLFVDGLPGESGSELFILLNCQCHCHCLLWMRLTRFNFSSLL